MNNPKKAARGDQDPAASSVRKLGSQSSCELSTTTSKWGQGDVREPQGEGREEDPQVVALRKH